MEMHFPALIALTYLLFSLLIAIFGFWKPKLAQPLAVTGASISSILAITTFISFLNEGSIRYTFGGWQPPIGIEFVYDGLSGFFVIIINIVAVIALIYSGNVTAKELPDKLAPYYTLSMLLMLGFNGMVLTGDMFNLYVFLEISSLSSYALLAIGNKKAHFSAFRYLLIGTIGGTLYLFGLGFLYTITGTLNMIDMYAILTEIGDTRVVFTALVLIIVGIGIKAALFPMHGWLPDSYANANSATTALIPPIGTKVAAYILFRVFFYVYGIELVNAHVPVTLFIGIFAAIGILYGSIMAIAQTDLKKMLAYSSVAQIGYIVLGLSMANPWAFAGALLHVLAHAVMKGGLFMVSGNLMYKEGHTDITKFDNSYSKKYPFTMAAFTVGAISMVGLPPLAGFFSKWYLVLGTVDAANWFFLAAILISSLLNAVYFFRILEKVYMKNPDSKKTTSNEVSRDEAPFVMVLTTVIMAIALIIIGLGNSAIVEFLLSIYPL